MTEFTFVSCFRNAMTVILYIINIEKNYIFTNSFMFSTFSFPFQRYYISTSIILLVIMFLLLVIARNRIHVPKQFEIMSPVILHIQSSSF